MADYSIIADTSNYLCKLLREKMCPEPIPSANNVQISSPASQDVDYLVGIYLYDVREEADLVHQGAIRRGSIQLQKPPKPYGLYYMVFINGSSQMGLKDLDIQKIIGFHRRNSNWRKNTRYGRESINPTRSAFSLRQPRYWYPARSSSTHRR